MSLFLSPLDDSARCLSSLLLPTSMAMSRVDATYAEQYKPDLANWHMTSRSLLCFFFQVYYSTNAVVVDCKIRFAAAIVLFCRRKRLPMCEVQSLRAFFYIPLLAVRIPKRLDFGWQIITLDESSKCLLTSQAPKLASLTYYREKLSFIA